MQPSIYTTGMTNVAEFMASGWPFAQQVTAGTTVHFPWVTNEIYVVTAGTPAVIGFSVNVTSSNYITVPPSSSLTMRVKVASLYTAGTGSFSLGASLTNIVPMQYPNLVGGPSVVYHTADDDSNNKIYPGV